MNSSSRRFLLLLLLWRLILPGSAGEPAHESLANFLGKLGYARVDLKRVTRPNRDRPGLANDLFLNVRVDSRKQKWQLDTGFSITSFDLSPGKKYKTLAELHREIEDPVLGRFGGNDFVLIRELELGPVRLHDQPAMVKSLGNHLVSGDTKAILGIDLLRRQHALVDFLGKGLFLRPERPDYKTTLAVDEMLRRSGWSAVTLVAGRSLCFQVETQVGGEPLRLLVDSGSEFTQLDLAAARRLGLKLEPTRMRMTGIENRSAAAYAAQIPLLQLAGLTVTNEPIAVVNLATWQSKEGQHLDGMIGADWLAMGRGVLDCQNGRLYLTPLDHPKK